MLCRLSPKSGLVRPRFGSFLFFFAPVLSVFCIGVSVGAPELYQSVYILNGSAVAGARSVANKRELGGWRMLGAIFTQVRAQICAREEGGGGGTAVVLASTLPFFPSPFEMFWNTFLGPAPPLTGEAWTEKSPPIVGPMEELNFGDFQLGKMISI